MARLKIATTVPTPPDVLDTIDALKAAIAGAGDTRLHVFLSPQLAKELLLNQPPEYQRRADRNTVDLYRRHMVANPSKWRHQQADNQLVFDADCGMMEGQHRCLAAVAAKAVFGAWVIGNQPKGDVKYLGQTRARALSHTMAMYGVHNATKIASVAKMFMFWTLNESPLASGRISPDEADEILGAYPEIQEWYLTALRIKRSMVTTPSGPWLTYILGQMFIADETKAQAFAEALENHGGEGMPGLVIRTWGSRRPSNSIAAKVWYHNTAARAWEAFVSGKDLTKFVGLPKDRLLGWK